MPSEDVKPVKKEESEDEDDKKCLGYILQSRKKKPNSATPKSHYPKEANLKKEKTMMKKEEEAEDDFEEPTSKKRSKKMKKEEADDEFEGPTDKKSPNKNDKKKKKKKEEEKKKRAEEAEGIVKKKERKVYDLPGQKRQTPEERDPLRIFYETLYEPVPSSEMAIFWMMESGLLSKEAAKKVFEMKLKSSHQQKVSSPMKAVITVKKTESVTVMRKTISSPVSTQTKKTPEPRVASKQSKKPKIEDAMSDDGSHDDLVLADKKTKKQRTG